MYAARFDNIPEMLHEMFEYFWENYIINVSIVYMNMTHGTVEAFTYYPFYERQACKTVYMEFINSFEGSWMHPLENFMFPEKLLNLQQCPLTVAVWNTPPYFSYNQAPSGLYEIRHFEADLLQVLAAKLNFTLDLKEPPNNEQRGKVLSNGSTTGALRMLQERTSDLSLGAFSYTLERTELMTAVLPYYQTWQIYGVIRRSHPYTSLEILFYAFDKKTWVVVSLSLQLAVAIAYKLQCRYSKSILARITLGFPKSNTPLMNIIRVIMGQAMTVLPQSNFTRFILIQWLLYGFLLRTAYQSMLFRLLHGNFYHRPPQSLAELIDNQCKLVMTDLTFDSVVGVEHISEDLIDVVILQNTSEMSPFYYIDSKKTESQCLAGVAPLDFLLHYVISENKLGLFYLLPEKVFTQHMTLFLTKHSFLVERFNVILMNLRSMGLIDFWAGKTLDKNYFVKSYFAKYKPISLRSLSGIFVIYSAFILLAIAIFCVELSLNRIRQFLGRNIRWR